MTLTVNNVNLIPYLEGEGYQWSDNDLDSEDAGRTLDGLMHRGRIAQKVKLQCNCRPLTRSEASIVLNAVDSEFVTVIYTDPKAGTDRTVSMYVSSKAANIFAVYDNGEKWKGIAFNLIEQ